MKAKKTSNSVKNPLTMIGIFAGISEIGMLHTIGKLPLELQKIFIWFVISFPFVLVVGFFFVLYRKPAVLFSPSDYKQDEMYLHSINNKPSAHVGLKIEQIEESVQVLQNFMEQIITTGNHNPEIKSDFIETKRKLTELHAMQQNNLFSFLKHEAKLKIEDIIQIINNVKDIRELPLSLMKITNDQWSSDRMQRILDQFPGVLSDFEQLKEIIIGGHT